MLSCLFVMVFKMIFRRFTGSRCVLICWYQFVVDNRFTGKLTSWHDKITVPNIAMWINIV